MANEVTAIIPNWNGAGRLERALESLRAQTMAPAAIVVVDNGSTDGSGERAEEWGARVVRLGKNHGFSRAVNEGARVSATPWLAIVNNDVELAPDWLERLLEGCVRGGAGYGAGRLMNSTARERIDGTYDLVARSGCAWRAGHGSTKMSWFAANADVSFVPLTAALVKREVFEQMSGLDERFESYLEDVDFCLRCALTGVGGLYVADATGWHEGGATLGPWSAAMVERIARNQMLLVAKHYPRGWFFGYGRAVLVGQLLWGAMAVGRGRGLAWLRGKWRGWRMWGEMRRGGQHTGLEQVLVGSEAEIRRLQKSLGLESYWAWYFRLSG